jgi:selenocysteine lyase/cysteine desulfurase
MDDRSGGRGEGVAGSITRSTRPGAEIDVDAQRARTRGCERGHHLNAAGSALPTREVVDTVVEHLRREELEGGYEAAATVGDRIEAVYRSAAALIGASPHEIALTDSASSGLRVVLDAIRPTADHTLVVSSSAYVSHALHLITIASETGAALEIVPAQPNGQIDLERLDEILASCDRAVVCPAHVPTSSGLVEPVVEIGQLTRQHGALYVLDATQSVGQLPVDVGEIGCDALVTTGRKFLRAPRGTAFLCVRDDLLTELKPCAPDVRGATWVGETELELAESAKRLEVWESYVAGRLGLGVAIDQAVELGIERTAGYVTSLADRMRADLGSVDGVVIADPAASASAIVTFVVTGVDPRTVVKELAAANVWLVAVPDSHAQWDLGRRGFGAVVRASVHVYNNAEDVAALTSNVERITARLS